MTTLNQLGGLIGLMEKSARTKNGGTEYRLTDFDIHEVSDVDHPANQEHWLVMKGQNMSSEQLLEIVGKSNGDFVAQLTDEAAKNQPPALKLTAQTKADTFKSIGAVVKGLIELAKSVNGAEVVTEGATGLPEEGLAVLRNSANLLAKMAGGTPKPAAPPAPDTGATNELAKFREGLSGISDQLAQFAGADVSKSAGGSNTEAITVLGEIATMVKSQGEAIAKLNNTVGLPATATPDSVPTQKSNSNEEAFVWDAYDMNRPLVPDDRVQG